MTIRNGRSTGIPGVFHLQLQKESGTQPMIAKIFILHLGQNHTEAGKKVRNNSQCRNLIYPNRLRNLSPIPILMSKITYTNNEPWLMYMGVEANSASKCHPQPKHTVCLEMVALCGHV